MEKYVYAISCVVTFFHFGTSVLNVFVPHKEHHQLGYTLLKIGNVLTWISTLALIFMVENLDPMALWAGSLVQVGCLLFFLKLKKLTKKKLTIAFSLDAPKQVFRMGPYKYIRHPYYTCYLLSYLSVLLVIPHALTAFNFLFMAAIYIWAAKMEEKKFSSTELQSEYQKYRAEAGMFWPSLSRKSS